MTNFSLPAHRIVSTPCRFCRRLIRLRGILASTAAASIHLIAGPRGVIVGRSLHTRTCLDLCGINASLIVTGQVVPRRIRSPFFRHVGRGRRRCGRRVRSSFHPLPIGRIPLFTRRVYNLRTLRHLGSALCGSRSPTRICCGRAALHIIRRTGGCDLRLCLPNVPGSGVRLDGSTSRLGVHVNGRHHGLILPRTLTTLRPSKTGVRSSCLGVHFDSTT